MAVSKLAQELIEKEKVERTGYLDLGRCGLKEIPDLSELEWLQTLVLSNQWWDAEKQGWIYSQNNKKSNYFNNISFESLPQGLENLVIGGDRKKNWKIKDWSFLVALKNIKALYLNYNQIKEVPHLEYLSKLSTLYLGFNSIKSLDFLGRLKNLSVLYLSYNQIEQGVGLDNLLNLTKLYLSYNNIRDVRFLENKTKLETLDLSFNHISNCNSLSRLTLLKKLKLNNNNIIDSGFLVKALNLETLDLNNNQISNINVQEKLLNLTDLYLHNNKIKNIFFLNEFPNLINLDLGNNQIDDFEEIANLKNLKKLIIFPLNVSKLNYKTYEFVSKFFPETKADINYIKNRAAERQSYDLVAFLRGLESSISRNDITKVDLEKQIPIKLINEQMILEPPREIILEGHKAILEYLWHKEKSGSTPLHEAKLILLGDGRAGKTSLASRLLGKELPEEADRTQGIEIIIGKYCFLSSEGSEFKLHIWDFAGQDKYKPLHQFFYTEGAVYVLVAESGNSKTDFDDWLQTAQLFGVDSPLLIALNEFREGIGYGTFDPEHWQKRFPSLLKEHFLVNLLSEKNVPALKMAIHHFAQSLPHTQVEYPRNWAAIRQELERRRDENFISFQEYLKICKENDLPGKDSAVILSSILHKIGVCLHYQQSDVLRQYVILKNEWATDAVYKIMEDKEVAELKKGFFDWNDLRRIWSDDTYNEMRPQLLELMQKFKMAYPLPNSQEFVAPPLLLPAPPQGWGFPKDKSLELFIEYEFLPKALLTQFIVSRHTDIDEGRTLVWRNGVVLRWPDALAEVVKTKSQGRAAFEIHSQGNNRKGLLTSILKTFRDLHSEYNDIKVSEIVPCSCSGCRSGKNKQHYFDFENLKNRLEKGRRIVECDQSLDEVELMALLGDLLVFEHLSVGKALVIKNTNIIRPYDEPISAPLAFFSYSKADTNHLKEFQKHLRPLERSGKIRLWDDLKIRPGEEWDEASQKNLGTAEIIFLLLSPDFLNTEYIWDIEMKAAIRRHEAGTAKVIPIKVRPCAWEDTPFNKLQGLPRNDQVISTARDQDAIWLEVVKEIKEILEDWR